MVKSPILDQYSKKIIENRLISIFSELDEYSVVERSDLPAVITERQFQESFSKISTKNSFLAAEQILICNILPVQDRYSINLKIEQVDSGIILAATDFFADKNITKLINNLLIHSTNLIMNLLPDSNIFINKLFIPLPIRTSSSFSKSNVIKINSQITGNSIDQIILFKNNFLSVGDPLKIIEYNLLNNHFLPQIAFEYAHWEVISSKVCNYSEMFACILNDGLLCVWDYNSWGAPYQFSNSDKIRKAICFGSEESIIFSGYSDGTIDFMDMNSFDIFETIKISDNEIKFLESIKGGLLVVDNFQNIFLYNFQLKKL